jgi:hypothetical protein
VRKIFCPQPRDARPCITMQMNTITLFIPSQSGLLIPLFLSCRKDSFSPGKPARCCKSLSVPQDLLCKLAGDYPTKKIPSCRIAGAFPLRRFVSLAVAAGYPTRRITCCSTVGSIPNGLKTCGRVTGDFQNSMTPCCRTSALFRQLP